MYQGKKVACLIMAAGHGTRMGKGRAKQFREVGGKSILERTLLRFANHPAVDDILIVTGEEDRIFCDALGLSRGNGKVRAVVVGGETREDSVWNGLRTLSVMRGDEEGAKCENARDLVLIQDAARPFTSAELIDRVLLAVNDYGAAIPVIPVRDTIKVTEGDWITGTLPRESLQGAQTPQGFERGLLTEAMRKGRKKNFSATDDASYVERFKGQVRKVPGDVRNIKITTIEDMATAEMLAAILDDGFRPGASYFLTGKAMPEGFHPAPYAAQVDSSRHAESSGCNEKTNMPQYAEEVKEPRNQECVKPSGCNEKPDTPRCAEPSEKRNHPGYAEASACKERTAGPHPFPPPMIPRIGEGYDVHMLVRDRKLVLGGVTIPYEKGLEGHSDADVMTHALMDSLLGAAGLGDIGHLFPDSDPAYEGIYSLALLEVVRRLLKKNGFVIGNVDVTLAAQKPKIAPYISQMKKNYSRILRIPEERVNIKGTTTERLGFVGREEGMACTATSLLFVLPKPDVLRESCSSGGSVSSGWTHLNF